MEADGGPLGVVPGSHRRPNTDAENAQLLEDVHSQISPEALQVKLKAGQGALYTNTILHWGSNYTSKLRRCDFFVVLNDVSGARNVFILNFHEIS